MSIDGRIAGPNGEMDWMVGLQDDKLMKYANELTESIETILLGRKMAYVFISYWSDVIKNLITLGMRLVKNDRNPKSCFHQNIEQIKVDKYRHSNR